MTRPRYDKHSTEFGLWLRKQRCIDSRLGYVATNLDYIWSNYKTGLWMLLEEKRFNAKLTFSQEKQFEVLHNIAVGDINYKGFHLITFENTSPDDGNIKFNNNHITVYELMKFLTFETIPACYFGGVLIDCL